MEMYDSVNGMHCPDCGSGESLSVTGIALFQMSKKGTVDVHDMSFTDEDKATCACGFIGIVDELSKEEKAEPVSKNENCLRGMRCPQCGNSEFFRIHASALFEVTDDGTGDYEQVYWDDKDGCSCPECDFSGIVRDFKKTSNCGTGSVAECIRIADDVCSGPAPGSPCGPECVDYAQDDLP